MRLPLLLGVVLLAHVSAVLWENVLSSYTITLKGMSKCKNEGLRTFYMENTKVRKISRNKVLVNTSMIVTKPMDNTNIHLDISQFSDGKWREHFFIITIGDLCTKVKQMIPKLLENILEQMPSKKCPFQVGNNTMTNLDFILDFNLPHMIYGTYTVDIIMKQKDKTIGCLQILVDINEKQSKKA